MPMRTSIEVYGDRARFVIATHDAVAHSALTGLGYPSIAIDRDATRWFARSTAPER